MLHLEHYDTEDNSSCPMNNLDEDSDISLTSMENTRNRRLLQEAISLQHQLSEVARGKCLSYYQEYSHQQSKELSKPTENIGDSNSQEGSFDEEYKTGEVTIENPPKFAGSHLLTKYQHQA